MSYSDGDKRWQKVYDFILEIGAGNLAVSLPTNNLEDNLDYLAGSLNMLTEELSTVIHRINPDHSYLHPIVLTIIVNKDLKILDIGQITANVLKYDKEILLNSQVYDLIPTEMHLKFYDEFRKFQNTEGKTSTSFKVHLKTSEDFLITTNCQFETLANETANTKYLLIFPRITTRNEFLEKSLEQKALTNLTQRKYPTKTRIQLHKDRIETLNKLHEYIIARLGTKLPSIDEISSSIGASKTKLKRAFKSKYGMGIHTYHRERRLQKAVLLLRKTEKTVETISRECGFVNRTHFSTVFKDRFGYRPTDLRKS